MVRYVVVVGCLLLASCSAPEAPDAWSVQRITPDTTEATTICDDVRALALGSVADEPDLDPVIDEVARIAAVVGAGAALPALNQIDGVAADPDLDEVTRHATIHDLLVTAAATIDDTTQAECSIPAFSAMYATTGFPDCHFEMELPIAAYTTLGSPGTCSMEGRPEHLPCWSDDGDHLAIDCVSGEIVTAVGESWHEAGEPREIVIERPEPEPVTTIPVVEPAGGPACAALVDIFTGAGGPDLDELVATAAALGDDVAEMMDAFAAATVSPPSLEDFEALVATLDAATVDRCGLPVVSAWTTLHGVDAVPCWTPTGDAYPAYEPIECT